MRKNQRIINYLKQLNKKLITTEQGAKLAKKIGACAFIECSSKAKEGVNQVFEYAAHVASIKQHENCCKIL